VEGQAEKSASSGVVVAVLVLGPYTNDEDACSHEGGSPSFGLAVVGVSRWITGKKQAFVLFSSSISHFQ